jgi:hypothetical protein
MKPYPSTRMATPESPPGGGIRPRIGRCNARPSAPCLRREPGCVQLGGRHGPTTATLGIAFDFYARLVQQYGSKPARATLGKDGMLVIALRNQSSTFANHGLGSYDDQIVVLNGVGRLGVARVFAACTEPGAQYSHRAQLDPLGKRPDARYASVKLRHADGDGRFDRNDPNRIDKSGAGTSMMIHWGGSDAAAEPNTWSSGCQTIPKNQYADFLVTVGRPTKGFLYVLLDAVDF